MLALRDPALGRSKAQRALGENLNEKRGTKNSNDRRKAFVDYGIRDQNVGMFSGPKPKYGTYQASPAASDVVKKLVRRGN